MPYIQSLQLDLHGIFELYVESATAQGSTTSLEQNYILGNRLRTMNLDLHIIRNTTKKNPLPSQSNPTSTVLAEILPQSIFVQYINEIIIPEPHRSLTFQTWRTFPPKVILRYRLTGIGRRSIHFFWHDKDNSITYIHSCLLYNNSLIPFTTCYQYLNITSLYTLEAPPASTYIDPDPRL